ncbi:MAG: hypothetical protein ACRC6T_02070 [Sarcina sp.]
MDVLSKTISSITAQNLLGWLVIGIIVITFVSGIILNVMIKRYYDDLNRDILEGINRDGDVYFQIPELNKILGRFKKSTECGTDNINTQVIIEKNLDDKFTKLEDSAKLIPAILIALGLLGTFLGLTLAIFETKEALTGIESINVFTENLQAPIASMATAFWTSIFGVLTSMILNFVNQGTKHSKNKFYNEMEDFLDNEIFANHAKTFNTIFEEFSKTVKITMLTLTEEMTNLFKNGVEELVTKINSSSIDLTESANGLQEYTKEFKGLVETFSHTVHSFEAPVESFNESVSNFVVTSENLSCSVEKGFRDFVYSAENLDKSMVDLTNNIDTSFESMSRSMDVSLDNLSANLGQCFTGISVKFENSMSKVQNGLDESIIRISNAVLTNAESSLEVAATIKEETDNLVINQNNIKDLISEVKKNNDVSNKEVAYQTVVLNKQTKSLDESLKTFSKSSEHIPIFLAERFSHVLKQYLDDVGIKITRHIDDNMGTIRNDIVEASRTLDETIHVIDSSREIMNSTNRKKQENSNYRSRRE